jgi:hypothetical protein
MFFCCECCVWAGRGLCDGLITRPEESYRPWCVVVCDQETSKNEEAKARYRAVENTTTMVCNARKTNKQTNIPYRHRPSGVLFPSCLSTKIMDIFLFSPTCLTCPVRLIFLDLIILLVAIFQSGYGTSNSHRN